MKLATGDLWVPDHKVVCVTTNGIVNYYGKLIMGGGVALQAAQRYPYLPIHFGHLVSNFGNKPFYYQDKFDKRVILSYPTKDDWRNPSSLSLIALSSELLVKIADKYELDDIYSVPPGIGLGGLNWDQVKPVIEPILDDRFTILLPAHLIGGSNDTK